MAQHKLGIGVAAAMLLAGVAQADTLRDAFARSYTSNPTLTAERARLRGTDEGVAIARAEGLPRVGVTASFTQQYGSGDFSAGTGRIANVGPSVTMPLFSGGKVRNGMRAADARVNAGRADLRTVEGDVFTDVVGAYMDVLRDEAIVSLNQGNVKVLETNLQASTDRFQVGDLTRTDVAQSQARLAGAHSQLASAEGNLTASRENYRRLVRNLRRKTHEKVAFSRNPPDVSKGKDRAKGENPEARDGDKGGK